jgi:hypothetical protein
MKSFFNLFIVITSLQFTNTFATKEDDLRNVLLNDYNKYTRPVINDTNTLDLKIGIEIKGLETFNQKDETAVFNIWMTMMWFDEYLTWNETEYGIKYINLDNKLIWKPDIELYNSASKAKVYNIQDNVRLKSDGHILWVRPASFAFSCPLELSKFPTDTQTCSMTFGSWSFPENKVLITPFDYKYDNTYLQENNIFVNGKIETIMEDYYDDDGYDDEYGYYSYYGYNYNDYENDYENDNYYEYEDYNTKITKNRTRRVFNTTNDKLKRQNITRHKNITRNQNHQHQHQHQIEYKNISISPTFTHNEWNIILYNCSYSSATYKCCPNDRWSVITFDISISRNPEKYYLTTTYIFILTFGALCINFIDNRNYNRTYILIFIPLSVIWVLISISNAIPVIDYFTKMDKILILSFIVCEVCTFISGIIYALNNSDYFNRFRYSSKFRPHNKYSTNRCLTTMIVGGLQDIIQHNFNMKKTEKTFEEKYEANIQQNRFILIKNLLYHFDYLFQFVVLTGFIMGYNMIYYK